MDGIGPSKAFKVRGATRGQGRTHGDQRTWWRGLRIAERRKTSTFRLLVQVAGLLVIALGKLGRGGTKDELAKPLIAVQRVQLPPDQSRADRSVVSVAIHRATGGCEAYTTRK